MVLNMAIYIETEFPAICLNKKCKDYKSFELHEFTEIKKDKKGDYVRCYCCKKKIYLED